MTSDKQTEVFLKQLGTRLRKVREAAGIQQVQLARRIKMDPTNLNKIERGAKNVTVDTLVRIARGLDARLRVEVVLGTEKR